MGTDDPTKGGDTGSPFTVEADIEATPMDVYQQTLDVWVISPLRVLWSDYRGRFGLSLFVLYVLMGTVGVVLVEVPDVGQGDRLVSPFQALEHPLGTDGLGQDLLGLMVHATPAMLKMIVAGAVFGGFVGVVVGIVAGYVGGTLDKVLMTITDTVGSIPGIPLLLIFVALIEPTNPWLVGIVLSLQDWTGAARGIRAQTLPIRKKEYVEASQAMGQSTSNTLFKDVLPELLPMITIGFMGGAAGIVNKSVGLYFLGILPFSHQNWGVVLNSAYEGSGALYSLEAAHWLLVPLITVTGMTLALTLLAQAFDQVFNPRVRARHEARKQREAEEPADPEPDESVASQFGPGGLR
jgi:peptide/nickel transport system permease protein